MGRIDDALRRSGKRDSEDRSPSSTTFVSPWSVSAGPEPQREISATDDGSPTGFFGRAHDVKADYVSRRPDLLATSELADPGLSSQHRRLAATLHNTQLHHKLKVILVTSALPGEGKTLTALNLALTLSRSYLRQVLLVDADLRRPAIHSHWEIPPAGGLSECLSASVDQPVPTYRVSKTLTVVPAGRPDPDPTSGVTSARMSQILGEARQQFDWVVLDTPPVSSVDDATLLSEMCDAAIFVVRARKTPYQVVSRSVESLGRSRIFGVVLNCVEMADSPAYGYYGYAQDEGYRPPLVAQGDLPGQDAGAFSQDSGDQSAVKKEPDEETSSKLN